MRSLKVRGRPFLLVPCLQSCYSRCWPDAPPTTHARRSKQRDFESAFARVPSTSLGPWLSHCAGRVKSHRFFERLGYASKHVVNASCIKNCVRRCASSVKKHHAHQQPNCYCFVRVDGGPAAPRYRRGGAQAPARRQRNNQMNARAQITTPSRRGRRLQIIYHDSKSSLHHASRAAGRRRCCRRPRT